MIGSGQLLQMHLPLSESQCRPPVRAFTDVAVHQAHIRVLHVPQDQASRFLHAAKCNIRLTSILGSA